MASKKGDYNPHSGDGASPGKIFIGGLAKNTTLETFIKYFEKYGEIIDSVIMKDRQTGLPRGFGFITYSDPSVVDQVIQETHVINDKQVEIKRTIPKGAGQANDFKTKKVFVGGIPRTVTEDELKDFFSKFGNVEEHQIIREHATNRSRGFGFVVFESEKVVDNLLANGNKIDMDGTQVEIKKAEPKKASNPAHVPAFSRDSRPHPYPASYDLVGNTYSGYGPGGYGLPSYGPPSYRSHGEFGSRFDDYNGYSDANDAGVGFEGIRGGPFPGYHGDSSFGYPSRFSSYRGGLGGGGGYGGSGLGAYGREARGYGSYAGSGSGDGYDSGPGASYEGPRGMYGATRAGYGGSSRYHPYGR
ncbi:PREDICTED: RNA-binding protein Musashi homolog 2-like [Fragaria vesca subsp. vesca]|uniref:RNA-binding protein Musashi homolog 2-like n=1 Tax=Fragaria vesca subsp. vesca TaxID=101020 RepID=UPI0002C36830|nr:PREDICTED: RNA-binding protein Musashi homolog 2-like [Fragaria vesca subsp. vesca]